MTLFLMKHIGRRQGVQCHCANHTLHSLFLPNAFNFVAVPIYVHVNPQFVLKKLVICEYTTLWNWLPCFSHFLFVSSYAEQSLPRDTDIRAVLLLLQVIKA